MAARIFIVLTFAIVFGIKPPAAQAPEGTSLLGKPLVSLPPA